MHARPNARADQHATALVRDGGTKGTMVSVVTVDRSAAADEFHNLKYVDIGPDADEPVQDGPEEVDYLFDADKLTFHTPAPNREKMETVVHFMEDQRRQEQDACASALDRE
jgi:hypothetical protein